MQSTGALIAPWARVAADAVHGCVKTRLYEVGYCSVMLTGGRSAEQLYMAWAQNSDFQTLSRVVFYFGDERCVKPEHSESNYGMVMRTLFRCGLPSTCELIRIEAEQPDLGLAASAYEARLPKRIDVLLLSMGEDGHIASLFPHGSALRETRRSVVPVLAPKPPFGRLTVTPKVIARAHQVFVMALGQKKVAVYEEAQSEPQDIIALPARLVLNATWFLDTKPKA